MIVTCVKDEGWRCLRGDIFNRRQLSKSLRGGVRWRDGNAIAWSYPRDRIAQDGKVRATADAIDGVDSLRLAPIEQRGGHGGEMTSGGKTDHSNPLRVHMILVRMCAHPTNGTLCV